MMGQQRVTCRCCSVNAICTPCRQALLSDVGSYRVAVCRLLLLVGLVSLFTLSTTSLLAGVKAGRVHLCRVAGNTV